MKTKVKRLTPTAQLPKRGSKFAAGADLYADINTMITIAPHKSVLIGTGIAAEIPLGFVGLVFARSGTAARRGLAPSNKVGVIDADYRGEIKISIHNHTDTPQIINAQERIAQLVITPYLMCDFEEVSELSETVRGVNGFGSTGAI